MPHTKHGEAQKRYWERNPEKRRESRKRYWARHPEKHKAIRKRCYDKHRDERVAKARQWHIDNRDYARVRARANQLLKKYGITLDQYNALGDCAICGAEKSNNGHQLSVDHDHETGKVRGKLCHECNTGLGLFKHDVELLAAAINYLEGGYGDT